MARTSKPSGPTTLAIDVGGTGLKAMVLGPDGAVIRDRVRLATTYPCPPRKLVRRLTRLVEPLGHTDRVSVGFPGVVRDGRVVTAPVFTTEAGAGTPIDPDLVEAWTGFDLDAALEEALDRPVRVANDADIQGAGAAGERGIDLIVTLGTGFGSTVFRDGQLALHLELAHHPLRKGATYNEVLGDAARKAVGNTTWRKRVKKALTLLDTLVEPDRILVGGGNAKRLKGDLPPKVRVISNDEGLLGGIRLWERSTGIARPNPLIEDPDSPPADRFRSTDDAEPVEAEPVDREPGSEEVAEPQRADDGERGPDPDGTDAVEPTEPRPTRPIDEPEPEPRSEPAFDRSGDDADVPPIERHSTSGGEPVADEPAPAGGPERAGKPEPVDEPTVTGGSEPVEEQEPVDEPAATGEPAAADDAVAAEDSAPIGTGDLATVEDTTVDAVGTEEPRSADGAVSPTDPVEWPIGIVRPDPVSDDIMPRRTTASPSSGTHVRPPRWARWRGRRHDPPGA